MSSDREYGGNQEKRVRHDSHVGHSKELRGVVAIPVGQGLHTDYANGVPPLESLIVDVGLLPAQVEKLVRVGDLTRCPSDLSLKFRAVGQLREDVTLISETSIPVRNAP